MLPLLNDYLTLFESLHADLNASLRDLTPAALDWSPGLEINSVAALAAHIAGAERFLVGTMALQDPQPRDRAAEFQTQAQTAESLVAGLDASLNYIRQALPRFIQDDLGREVASPRGDRRHTIGWCLAHALEHTAQHLAHIQLTLQFYHLDQKA